jgi:hypothetical protein
MANVVGTWSLTKDWGCGGSITGSFNQTFNADGTWSSAPFVHQERWFQVEGLIAWTFNDTPNLVYAPTLWEVGWQESRDTKPQEGSKAASGATVPAYQPQSRLQRPPRKSRIRFWVNNQSTRASACGQGRRNRLPNPSAHQIPVSSQSKLLRNPLRAIDQTCIQPQSKWSMRFRAC